MKRMLIVLVAIVSLAFVTPAFANGPPGGCPPGQVKKGWKCVPEGGDEGGSTIINNENKNTNYNTNFNTNVNDIDNSSRNTNTNLNTNLNTNKNTNTNTNVQGQQQGQQQGQIQGQQQGQSQEANNTQSQAVVGSGNSKQGQAQSVDIKFEADKRELLGLTAAPTADAKVKDTKASKIRAKGDLLDRVKFLTMSMAKKASKNASDMEVEAAVLFENDFELDRIIVGEGEVFGGYIYVFADGPDCYLAAMDAEASEVAMKLGMTHIVRLGEVELTKVLDGSAWNIGVGGGASIMTSGEDIGIAPNGGLGYGKARTSSEFRPDAVYEVSYSADLIREK